MIEIKARDIFDLIPQFNAICITTNGMLRPSGDAICGAGIALAAKQRYYDFEKRLGEHIKKHGNTPGIILWENDTAVISLPTKNDWRNKSDIKLIKGSLYHLLDIVEDHGFKRVAMPRPGCRNGGLDWSQIRYEIGGILDHRFYIVDKVK